MLTIDPLDLAAAVERDTFWFSGLRSIFANASAGCRRALPLEHRSISPLFAAWEHDCIDSEFVHDAKLQVVSVGWRNRNGHDLGSE